MQVKKKIIFLAFFSTFVSESDIRIRLSTWGRENKRRLLTAAAAAPRKCRQFSRLSFHSFVEQEISIIFVCFHSSLFFFFAFGERKIGPIIRLVAGCCLIAVFESNVCKHAINSFVYLVHENIPFFKNKKLFHLFIQITGFKSRDTPISE